MCPGVIGSLQASEAKLLLGAGDTLVGRLLLFDALGTTWDEVAIRRDPACPVCGDSPTITEYVVTWSSARRRPRSRVVTAVRIPPTLRAEVGGARQLEADGETVRDVLDDLTGRYPALAPHLWEEGEVAPFVERLRWGRGRADPRRARDAGQRLARDPPARNGGWLGSRQRRACWA